MLFFFIFKKLIYNKLIFINLINNYLNINNNFSINKFY